MLAVPVMALVMSPVQAAGILLPVYIISDIGGLIAFRRDFDRQVLRTVVPGAVAGILAGLLGSWSLGFGMGKAVAYVRASRDVA